MMYPITTLSIILICALVIVIAYTWYKTSKLKKQLDIAVKSNVALTSINKDNKVEIQKLKQLNIDYEDSLSSMSIPSKPKTETTQPLHIKKESNVKEVPIIYMNDSFDPNAYSESNFKSSDYGSSSSSSSYDSSSSSSSSDSSSSSSSSSD